MKKSPAELISATKITKPPGKTTRKRLWSCGLREKRKKLNLTIRDVAEGVGLSHAAVFEIEQGTDPQLSTAKKLASFFGVPIDSLWPSLRAGD